MIKKGWVTGYQRGHLIEYDFDNERWLYADDKSPISVERPCIKCGRLPTPEGYDACLGYMPNVKSACCGHGVENPILLYTVNCKVR